MKNESVIRLYNLLPSIYRQRDIAEGKPLEALLSIIEQELKIIEDDIGGLYENWFIETCDEWAIPYIGDLVGAKLLRSVENTTISQRAYVANTIRYRRRKGTAAVLEQVARDVTGWDARAVEFFQLLCTTQNINHLRLGNVSTPNLRDEPELELLNSALDTIPHTIDVRNIRTKRSCHNIPNVGVFLWRLQAYPVKKAPAFIHKEAGKYSFSQIGHDMPLFNHPVTEASISNFAEETNVPTPIRRSALKNNFNDYYGAEKSILLEYADESHTNPQIIVCDLSNWEDSPNWKKPPSGTVAIDPVNGRIWNPEEKDLYVTYYYGFSSDVGGGFYYREPYSPSEKTEMYPISKKSNAGSSLSKSFSEAHEKWVKNGRPNAVFEFLDSEIYEIKPNGEEEKLFTLEIPEKVENKGILIVRSAQEQRPVLMAKSNDDSQEFTFEISGGECSQLVLEGLIIDNSISFKIKSDQQLNSFPVNHCTLVPGKNNSISLDGGNDGLVVTLSRSISGRINLKNSGAQLHTTDSIIDVKTPQDSTDNSIDNAIECCEARIDASTVFGKMKVDVLRLASNSIFTNIVTAKRRQEGCVRFSYLPEESLVPRRYRCQPEYVFSDTAKRAIVKVYPRFTSEKYGDPGYAQLHANVSKEILEGAENEAEMGAFNHLYQSKRISNIQVNSAEYLRFGLELGIFLVT